MALTNTHRPGKAKKAQPAEQTQDQADDQAAARAARAAAKGATAKDAAAAREPKKFTMVMGADLADALDALAAEDDRSRIWLINRACQEYVERRSVKK